MPVRAAIYARFSTDLQSDRSIDDQVTLCRSWAARNDCTVVETYSDRARSGTSVFGRDGLFRLLDDAKAGRFGAIIVESLDRLSRDQEDLAGIYKRMSFAGIRIETVHDGAADALQIGLRGLVSSIFIQDLKHKIRRGMSGVVRDGRNAGGRAYGYRPLPGRPGVLEIVADEAAVVRRVFADYLGGISPKSIAARLNAEGILPPRGKLWNGSTIIGSAGRGAGILRNELYAGTIVWNKVRMLRDPDTGRRVSRVNDASEQQRKEAPELAIVSRDAFDAAQALARSRRDSAAGGGFVRAPKRILSGLLRCGHCGGGMSIKQSRNGVTRIQCTRSVESGACNNRRTYRLENIERAVVDGLKSRLDHPELIAAYVKAYRDERMRDAAEANRNRAGLARKHAQLASQVDRLLDLYARGEMSMELFNARALPLQDQWRAVGAQLAELPAAPAIELHPQAVARYLATVNYLSERLGQLDLVNDREEVTAFRSLIAYVVVRDGENGKVVSEVMGALSALTNPLPAGDCGGAMVAGARLEPSPTVSLGRFAA